MTEQIDYKQMAMVLLSTCDAMKAALEHANIEPAEITFVMTDKDGNAHETTSTVDGLMIACRYALGMQANQVTTTEHSLGDA